MKFIGKVVLTFSILFASSVYAIPRLDIDADTTMAGIQASRNVGVGAVFDVEVRISDADGLYSYDIDVGYDAAILGATATTEGDFLTGVGTTLFLGSTANPVNALSVLLGAPTGASGNGLLFTVQFTALATGISSLQFLTTDLAALIDGDFVQVDPLEVGGANITVQSVPLPSSFLLFGAGLGLIGLRRRGRR